MAIEKKVLLIAEAPGFMVNTIQDNIRSAGYEVLFCTIDVKEIGRIKEFPPVILVYLGDYVDKASDAFVYLKDICLEKENKLFLIGDNLEFKKVFSYISQAAVTGTFSRPLNVKSMVASLDTIFEKITDEDKRKSILVVDDDGLMLRTIKSWLDSRYKIAMANSAMTAITYLVKNRPDLILLDYEMPVCSGPQALEMIRNEPTVSDVPVIFLTAKGDKESVMKVLALKPEGYLLKTMEPTEIVASIDKFFEDQKLKNIRNSL